MRKWIYLTIGALATTVALGCLAPELWLQGFLASIVAMLAWSRYGWHALRSVVEETTGVELEELVRRHNKS